MYCRVYFLSGHMTLLKITRGPALPSPAPQVYAVACRLAPISLGVTLVGKESRPRTAPVDATVYIAPVHSGDLQPVYWHYSAVPHVVVLDEVDVLMYQQKEYMDRLLLDPPEGVARQLLMFGATVCEDRVMRYMEEEYGLLAAWEYLDLVCSSRAGAGVGAGAGAWAGARPWAGAWSWAWAWAWA